MILVERHIIERSHRFYDKCDDLCFRSKNLYNQGLFNIRQHYFKKGEYLDYVRNYHITSKQESYKELPAKVSNQTLKLLDKNFQSFFALIKAKNPIARLPNYLDKAKGRYITKFEKQAVGKRDFKKLGLLNLSKTNISIKTKVESFDSIKEVRIIPRIDFYVIEVVYEKSEKALIGGNLIAAIDPGLNNLATVVFNKKEADPFTINGRVLKSINQFYNKKKAKLQSILEKEGKTKSKRLNRLTQKRNKKMTDLMHKSSRLLVNQLVENNVGTLVIGKNVGQKQDSNMGCVGNQNFVPIPLFKFLDMVAYKATLEGIEIIWQEESYTSKASFFSGDEIPTYKEENKKKKHVFSGYRTKKRGLYKIKGQKKYVNSDINGALNILKKAVPNAFVEGIEGIAVYPKLTLSA